MRIGIDLDGCVYDYVGAMRRHFMACGRHRDSLPDPDHYEIWECWGMTSAEFWQATNESIAAGLCFGIGVPYKGAVDALAELNDAGHTLHIVTARRRTARAISLTARWLERHGIEYKSLTFSSDKRAVPVDLFVEDSTRNALEIAAATGRPLLLDRTWNRDAPPWIDRAYSWGDVVASVAKLDRAFDDAALGSVAP
jgi:uncharacterized HAD superfamily protein